MTTPSASLGEDGWASHDPGTPSVRTGPDGRGLCFWYQATRMARASASCRYRMGNLAEQLPGATTVTDPRPPLRVFDRASVVVVVRPFVDGVAATILDRLRRRGVRLVADYDDLLFAGDPAEFPRVMSGAFSQAQWKGQLAGYRSGLDRFDAFTVSTEPLAEQLRAVLPGAEVAVVPNGVSPRWLRQGRALYLPWQPGDPKVIRFLPGSPSHDADFAAVVAPLAEFLRSHREARLEILGPLELDRASLPVDQVTRGSRVPYAELPRLLASSWLTLAPLAPTAFNRCKSALKFLESAAFAAPCLGSPNADMERHTEGGVLLARDHVQWREALERLLDDDRRMALGSQGKRHVDQRGCATVGAGIFAAWVAPWRRP